jgi:molybdenum cofactor cytidylyltransferase
MGRAKLGLPLGNSTLLERTVAALRDGGVERVLVVVGPRATELISSAESAGGTIFLLPAPTADMRETVQAGLRYLEERYHPHPENAWFLTPGDCPGFAPSTVRQLLEFAAPDSVAIKIPTYRGRRGHPALFSWHHAAEILTIPPGLGIDSFVRSRVVREVPVEDPGVLTDLDTPADYEQFQKFRTRSFDNGCPG